jgi:hypothetical protein
MAAIATSPTHQVHVTSAPSALSGFDFDLYFLGVSAIKSTYRSTSTVPSWGFNVTSITPRWASGTDDRFLVVCRLAWGGPGCLGVAANTTYALIGSSDLLGMPYDPPCNRTACI